MKDLVPDFAMVPRLFTRSALVIPMPVSWIVTVLSSLLGVMVIFNSFSESRTVGSVRLWYLILSKAWVCGVGIVNGSNVALTAQINKGITISSITEKLGNNNNNNR